MKLNHPFEISSRLLPAVRVGKSTISIKFSGETSDGRARYEYFIDTPEFEYSSRDLKSGVCGGSLQSGMESLLAFLGAAAEAHRYSMSGRTSENSDLFPANVTEWAYQNSDEISILECELNTAEDADLLAKLTAAIHLATGGDK